MLKHPPNLKYRPDIDGLRAVAVLSVVAFHAFSSRGGFLGVDIFFVISGFLISSIIFGEIDRGAFSLVEFYRRRILRIFPALLLILVFCYQIGWLVLLADEFSQLGKHIAGGAGFIANLILFQESGYFDNAAETKPLLHLWSLGIEEQFYIFWPILIWLTWKLRWPRWLLIGGLGLGSFAINAAFTKSDPVGSFYLPHMRVWELLIGAGLAHWNLASSKPSLSRPIFNNIVSVVGALLIAAAQTVSKGQSNIVFTALLTTIGAAMIIFAGPHSLLNRFVLSNRLMVGIGLISYPLYLWHWPLLSFLRIVSGENPPRQEKFIAVLLSFLLAWLTYKLLERPIRFGKNYRPIAPILAGLMIVMSVAGAGAAYYNGIPFRVAANPEVVAEGDIGHDFFPQYHIDNFLPCTPASLKLALKPEIGDRCYQSKNGPREIVIIGDSHAEHLFPGLAEKIRNRNVAYYILTTIPSIDNRLYAKIYKSVIEDPNIKSVIISGYWNARLHETPTGSTFKAEMKKVASALTKAGKKVYFTDDTPNFSFEPKRCKFRGKFIRKEKCNEGAAFYGHQLDAYKDSLAELAAEDSDVRVIHTSGYLCDKDLCYMGKDGKLFYRDYNHLNLIGSKFIAERILADHPELAL